MLRLNRLREERERAGAGIAEQPRKKPGSTAIGDERDLGESLDELRGVPGKDDVTGECEIGAPTGGNAVDCANDRFRHRTEQQHQWIIKPLHDDREVEGWCTRTRHTVGEILPSTKPTARAGDQHGTRRLPTEPQ